jgi:hypothetical protein
MSDEKQPVQEGVQELSVNQRARQEALETLHQVLHRAAVSGVLPEHEASVALKAIESHEHAVEELLAGFEEIIIGFTQMFAESQATLFEMNLTQKATEKVLMDKKVVSLEELEVAARELYGAYKKEMAKDIKEEDPPSVVN